MGEEYFSQVLAESDLSDNTKHTDMFQRVGVRIA